MFENSPPIDHRFIGRAAALARLEAWRQASSSSSSNQITIWGCPGVGKTTLARECAARWAASTPIYWLPLHQLSGLSALCVAIAQRLGLTLEPGVDEPAQVLARLLIACADLECVLFMDEADRLITQTRQVIAALAQGAPGVRMVTTTRQRLGLHQEQLLELEPLEVPSGALSPEEVFASEAAQHFLMRLPQGAPALSPDAQTAALLIELIARQEGLPLALALLAPWAELLSLKELIARQAEALVIGIEPGHSAAQYKTLAQAVNLSWELASPQERDALALLCVFDGELTTALVESLFDSGAWGLAMLRQLRYKSLLQTRHDEQGQPRHTMARFIREFVRDKVALEPHLERALGGVAKVVSPWRHHLERGYPLQTIEAARHTRQALQSALNLAISHELYDLPALSQCALFFAQLCCLDPAAGDADTILSALLSHACAAHPDRLDWLHARAKLAHARQRFDAAHTLYQQLEQQLERLDPRELSPKSRARYALDAAQTLYYIERIDELELALGRAQDALDELAEGDALYERGALWDMRAKLCHIFGDRLAALERFEQALGYARQVQDKLREARIVHNLAIIYTDSGHFGRAHDYLMQALQQHHEHGDWLPLAQGYNSLGVLLMRERRFEAALEAYDDATKAFKRCGVTSAAPMIMTNEAMVMLELGRYEDALHKGQQAQYLLLGSPEVYLSGAASLVVAYAHWFLEQTLQARQILQDRLSVLEHATHWQLRISFYSGLGGLYAIDGLYEQAQEAFAQAQDALPAGDDPILEDLITLHQLHVPLHRAHHAINEGDDALGYKLCFEVLNTLSAFRQRDLAHERAEPLRFATTFLVRAMPQWLQQLWRCELEGEHVLWVSPQASFVRPPRASWFDLSRSPAQAQLLNVLVQARVLQPGAPLNIETLISRTWQGEHIEPESAANRLHVNLSKLRKAGLQRLLLRVDDGYMLDPEVELGQWSDEPH